MFLTGLQPRSLGIKKTSGGATYSFPWLQALVVVDLLCISGQTMSNPGTEKGFVNVSN